MQSKRLDSREIYRTFISQARVIKWTHCLHVQLRHITSYFKFKVYTMSIEMGISKCSLYQIKRLIPVLGCNKIHFTYYTWNKGDWTI